MRQRKDPTRKAAKNLGNVKIEATASDGVENASDHFVTSFLVLGHRKGGVFVETPPQSVKKSGGAGGTASCRGYRGGAPNPCAAALSPQTSVALFAGAGGQLGVFRQAEAELRKKLRLGYINRNDVQDYSLFVREHIV